MSEEVKRFSRPDGKYDLLIFRRPDGLFELGEELELQDDEGYAYWTPVEGAISGILATVEAAEREARARFPWIDKSVEKPSGEEKAQAD